MKNRFWFFAYDVLYMIGSRFNRGANYCFHKAIKCNG